MNYVFFLTLIVSCIAFAEGGHVGNGGDGIVCGPTKSNPFDGYYTLDYLLTYRASNQNADIVSVKTWELSLQRIRNELAKKMPSWAMAFENYVTYIFNTTDHSKARFWEEASFGLVDISDEKIVNLVPPNCRLGDKIRLEQAVIRRADNWPTQIIYKYAPSVIENLGKTSPIQLSFLFVHEWLWDLTSDVESIRRLNRFLHSQDLENLDADQVQAQLTGLLGTVSPVDQGDYNPFGCADSQEPPGFLDKPSYSISKPFRFASRQRGCSFEGDCSSWIMHEFSSLPVFFANTQVIFTKNMDGIYKGQWLALVSKNNTGIQITHTKCKIVGTGVDCGLTLNTNKEALYYPLFDRTAVLGDQVHLVGHITSKCLELRAHGHAPFPLRPTDYADEELVLNILFEN